MIRNCDQGVLLNLTFLLLLCGQAAAEELRPSADLYQGLSAELDWPWWRGPTRDGVAFPGQTPPLRWSVGGSPQQGENILWGAPIPGRGHGSPTIVGDQVFLATADVARGIQSVLCLDRHDGKLHWQTDVHRGAFDGKGNAKSSHASVTAACDGERIFVNFLHAGAVYATALRRNGRQLWQTKVSDFVVHQGYGASPTLYGSQVMVASDNKGSGVIAALERDSGKIVWKRERPAKANYTSPILLNVGGRDQLLLSGCDLVTSLEPLTGKALWEIEGSTTECVTSVVSDGQRVFVSGGYPRNHLAAVRADGSGKIDWENGSRVYVPSMIVHDGHLYATLDAGIASCWNSASGQEMWKERLGGTFSSSLVLVGDTLLGTDESGRTIAFKANPSKFDKVAENQLGDECFSTPAVCGNRIYLRVAETDGGERQEYLYCLGRKS